MPIEISGTTVIDNSRNVTNVGSITASSFIGSGANLSGVQAGSSTFTASGAISNGDAVLVNSNGTVSAPTVTTSDPPNLSSAVRITSDTRFVRGVDIGSGKVVFAYAASENSHNGEAIVGTVSGNSISFGNPTTFETQSVYERLSITYDSSNEKVVIAYKDSDNSNRGTAIVGTVSDTSISFGSPVIFETGNTQYISATYDSSNNKVVIAYKDSGDSNKGKAIVGTVSGTSISFGSAVEFNTGGNTDWITSTYDSTNNKVVIAYQDGGNSFYGTAIVGTVSGTSISFGSEVVFESASAGENSAVYDSTNGKVVIAYHLEGTSNGKAIVGTVSGTSISFGTAAQYESSTPDHITTAYDSANGKVIISYMDDGDSDKGTAVVATVSGTSISFGTVFVYNNAITPDQSVTYVSAAKKSVLAYRDSNNEYEGYAKILDIQNTTISSDNFIGIAAEAISNAATGSITMVTGINASQSGLTAGQQYYVQKDGSLNTVADSPSLFAGTAISATELIVKR